MKILYRLPLIPTNWNFSLYVTIKYSNLFSIKEDSITNHNITFKYHNN